MRAVFAPRRQNPILCFIITRMVVAMAMAMARRAWLTRTLQGNAITADYAARCASTLAKLIIVISAAT